MPTTSAEWGLLKLMASGLERSYPQGKYWKFKGRSKRREGTEEAQSLRDLLSPENFRLSPGRDGLGDSEASEGSLALPFVRPQRRWL